MFSGIVAETFRVLELKDTASGKRLALSGSIPFCEGLRLGASIAINGVCLSVVEFDLNKGQLYFDVVPETLKRSNLGSLQAGDLVNSERSLKIGDELGGHFLSGHIDSLGRVVQIKSLGSGAEIEIEVDKEIEKYIFEKGFVAVNGASLTVAKKLAQSFLLAIIPDTRSRTNIGNLEIGDLVNIEIDRQTQAIVDTVERMLSEREHKAT